MSDAFVFEVPADARFRGLAPEMAGRYMDILGGSDADREACERRLVAAIDELAPPADGTIVIRFRPGVSGIEMHVESGGRSVVVTRPLPASMK